MELTTGTCVRLKSGRVARLTGPVGHPSGPMMLVQDHGSDHGSEYRVPVDRVDVVITDLAYRRIVRETHRRSGLMSEREVMRDDFRNAIAQVRRTRGWSHKLLPSQVAQLDQAIAELEAIHAWNEDAIKTLRTEVVR